jgi:c-di-GMP-binding flagellar brake protein YcgR
MEAKTPLLYGPSTALKQVERRDDPRISNPFPVRVEGVDTDGNVFEVQTVLDNLSSGGLYVRLFRTVKPGVKLSIRFRFLNGPAAEESTPCVVAQGVVVRTEPKVGGACGVAVMFKSRRFLYGVGPV